MVGRSGGGADFVEESDAAVDRFGMLENEAILGLREDVESIRLAIQVSASVKLLSL